MQKSVLRMAAAAILAASVCGRVVLIITAMCMFTAMALSTASGSALASVLIQEAYPSPLGTASGGEAVLLYNDAGSDADISGWTLGTDSSATDATVPANTTLAPRALYLIADTGWSVSKDNPSWAAASHEEAITLRDSPATLTLRAADGTVVDSVGYPDPDKGVAYWRMSAADTMLSATEPLFSPPLDALFLIGVSGVTDESSSPAGSGNISVTDNGTPARAVRPLAGRTKYLIVDVSASTAPASSGSSAPTVSFLGASQQMEQIGANRWTADIGLPYDTPPGFVNVTTDTGLWKTLEILPLLAIESDATSLELGNASSLTGDAVFGSGGPTLRNAGNVALEIYATRTAVMRNGSRTLSTSVTLDTGDRAINVTSTTQLLTTLAVGASAPLSIIVDTAASATIQTGDYTSSLALQLKQR